MSEERFQAMTIEDVCQAIIGKVIYCEDDVPRRVTSVVPSYIYPWRLVVNEEDPTSRGGYFLNVLDATCQILNGKRAPKGAAAAMARIAYQAKMEKRNPTAEIWDRKLKTRFLTNKPGKS